MKEGHTFEAKTEIDRERERERERESARLTVRVRVRVRVCVCVRERERPAFGIENCFHLHSVPKGHDRVKPTAVW